MQTLQQIIETAYEIRTTLTPRTVNADILEAVDKVVELLDDGSLRIAEKVDGEWKVHEWLKKAISLYFCVHENKVFKTGCNQYFDKIPLKFADDSPEELHQAGVRIVPTAVARKGAYVAPNTILMPSYVNIGAYVDTGTLIDTWATIGSCAQIGKNVHISGGAGIGGVLEPIQAKPTIIEDNCFIGARSEIVEGVIIGEGSVISMGVFIGQSTRIYQRKSGKIFYGYVPPGSVVVPGNLPSEDGKYSLYCAVIVKEVDSKTLSKVNLNELLRASVE